MVPKLKDILNNLDEIAPFSKAEEWDNSGLQVGSPEQEIKKILIALDPTVSALKKARSINAQLLLTHHPLIFTPISQLDQKHYPSNIIFEAINKKIAVVSAHTNLDVSPKGINHMLAELFDLHDTEILKEDINTGPVNTGLGRIGYLNKPAKLSQMIEMTKRVLENEKIRVTGLNEKDIRKVAIVGGSGGGLISAASQKGAELLITGDISHHQALEAEAIGLALIDGGHFHTEKAALRLFADFFRKEIENRGWNAIVEFYEDEKSVIRCK